MKARWLTHAGASLLVTVGVLLGSARGVAAQLTEFGFEFDGRITIPVFIDGAGPIQVILDSGLGSGILILNHSETGEEMGLDYARTQPAVRGAGSGEIKDLHLTAGNELSVPGLVLGTKPIGVIDESRTESGLHNLGVTGGLLLFRYTVEIDFDASKFVVYDPDSFQTPEGWTEIPLDFAKNLPLVETTLRMGDGEAVPVRLIIDTGGKPQLGLTIDEELGLVPASDAVRVLTGTGLRGDVYGRLGRVDEVKLGPFALEGMVAGFWDGEEGPILEEIKAEGLIGIGALYRFNLIFDFARRRLLIKPNRHFADPFEWNMAGVVIRPDPQGNTVIYHVEEGSEAEADGLMKRDVVLGINGRVPSDYSYLELRKVFEEDGGTVELQVKRGKETRLFRLSLRRIV